MKRCRNTAGVILAVLLLTGCGTVTATQEDSEILPSETTLPEMDMPVDESEEETVEPEVAETESEAEASEEEDVVQYDCAPISYDLTQLPAMKNEFYAEWEGKIYFRQYSDEDVTKNGAGTFFSPIADTEKELMCMEADGSVTQVGVDYGWDEMYIVEGRIYSHKWKKEGEKSISVVYSCGLDGSDVIEYASHEVLAVRGDRIICGIGYDDGISWIDAKDGQEHILAEEFDFYHEGYLDATEDEIFCSKLVRSEEAEAYNRYSPYDLVLYSMDYQGNTKDLASFTLQEYESNIDCTFDGMHLDTSPLFIPYFQILGDDLYFTVGTTNGTGHGWTGGLIYGMKKDGSNCQMLVSDSYSRYFYLYDDGQNRALYFASGKEAEGIAAGNGWMRQILLSGEAQEDVVPYEADGAYDEPQVYVSRNHKDSILFYPGTSGICYVLLTAEECEKLEIQTTFDDSSKKRQLIDQIEYLEGRLFFTVTDLIYREEFNSSHWGYGYERGKSRCYCKDLESGEIRLLYEY